MWPVNVGSRQPQPANQQSRPWPPRIQSVTVKPNHDARWTGIRMRRRARPTVLRLATANWCPSLVRSGPTIYLYIGIFTYEPTLPNRLQRKDLLERAWGTQNTYLDFTELGSIRLHCSLHQLDRHVYTPLIRHLDALIAGGVDGVDPQIMAPGHPHPFKHTALSKDQIRQPHPRYRG